MSVSIRRRLSASAGARVLAFPRRPDLQLGTPFPFEPIGTLCLWIFRRDAGLAHPLHAGRCRDVLRRVAAQVSLSVPINPTGPCWCCEVGRPGTKFFFLLLTLRCNACTFSGRPRNSSV